MSIAVATCAVAGLVAGWLLAPIIERVSASRSTTGVARVSRPLVAAVTAALAAATAWRLGWSWQTPAYLLLVAFLVVLSFVDLGTKTLPRRIVYAAGLVGVVLLTVVSLVVGEPERIGWAAIGALGAFAVLWLLHGAVRGGLGFGDVRFGAVLGWYLAWQGLRFVPVAIVIAFALSAVVGVALLASGRAGRRTAVPFGPFLAGAAVIVLVGGPSVVGGVWPA